MSWLRLDDRTDTHPKIIQLPRADRWTWAEVLLYCARHRTEGRVPAAISEVNKHATPAFLNRLYELHLLDLDEDGYLVHDWPDYNPKDPTAADRQRRHRALHDRDIDRDTTVTEPLPRARASARGPSRPQEVERDLSVSLSTSSPNPSFPCPRCGIKKRTQADLDDHLRNVHAIEPDQAPAAR